MRLYKKNVQTIVDKYNLDRVVSFLRIKKGFMNYSYDVKTEKGRFILRISKKTKKKKDKMFEIKMVNHIKGLPVPNYLKDSKGNYVNVYDGHYYSIYKYLQGSMPPKNSNKLNKQIAHFLGRFHNRIKTFESDIDRFAWYTFSDERADEFRDFLLKNLSDFKDEINLIFRGTLKHRLPDNLPSGPIHCDVKRHNILSMGNKLTGVVDFDNCQIGPFILDLAISITWLCAGYNGLDYKKTYNFIKWYEQKRKLSYREKEYLFRAIKYACYSHELVDFYVYTKRIISKDYFMFGKKYFLNIAKSLSKKKYKKYVESPLAGLNNFFI